MKSFALALLFIAALLAASVSFAEVRFFDMGTADSKVYEGATRVTAQDLYSADTGFGWQSAEGLSEQARAYEEMGDRRGSPAPPVMWTNAITEDCVIGESSNQFLVDLPDGAYRVYALCGTSDRARYQVWDFTVVARDSGSTAAPADDASAWVQMAGGRQHRPVRLRAEVDGGALALDLGAQSKWVVSAILIASEDEWARVEQEIIDPLEEWVFFLPPEQQENWTFDPPPDPEPMPELSQADRDRGWVLFHRPWAEVVWPNTLPRAEEINPEVRIFATPGEYEPVTFCVNLLRDAGDLTVETTDVGPVAADTIDIRHVRYMRARPNYVGMGLYRVAPDALEPRSLCAMARAARAACRSGCGCCRSRCRRTRARSTGCTTATRWTTRSEAPMRRRSSSTSGRRSWSTVTCSRTGCATWC